MRDHSARPEAVAPSRLVPLLLAALCLFGVAARPAHAASWSHTGPEGGEVFAFAEDPLRAGHLFAAPSFAGLFESIDGGMTWREVANAPREIRWITFDPFDPQKMYIVERSGFRVTTDGGKSWSDATRAVEGDYNFIYALDASPRERGLLYMQTTDGIYRSRDGGGSWTYLPQSGVSGGIAAHVAASTTRDGVVFASARTATLRSSDYGVTWRQAMPTSARVTFSPQVPERGVAASFSGVYTTSNGGDTWIPPGAGAPKIFRTTFDPAVPGRLYGMTATALYRSDDWGASWTVVHQIPLPSPALVVATRDPARVFLTAGGFGVLESTGGALVPRNRGLMALPATALLAYGDRLLAGTYGGGSHVSVDRGEWRRLPPGTFDPGSAAWGERVVDLVQSGQSIVMASSNGLYRSFDGGESWQNVAATDAARIMDIEPGEGPHELFASGWSRMQRSVDGGASWTLVPWPFSASLLRSVAFDKTRGQLFVSATTNADPLYRSSDRGVTWTALGATPFPIASFVAVSPHGGLYAVGADTGVFRSDDGGDTWTKLPGQSPKWSEVATTLAFDPADPTALVVGTSRYGAYVLTPGDRWIPVAELAGREILKILRAGTRWVFATDKGVYVKEDPLLSPARRRASQ